MITVPCSVFIYRALTKDEEDNPAGSGASKSEVEQVVYAVEEVAERNYEIIKDYSKNNSSDAQNYAVSLDLESITNYFYAFATICVVGCIVLIINPTIFLHFGHWIK